MVLLQVGDGVKAMNEERRGKEGAKGIGELLSSPFPFILDIGDFFDSRSGWLAGWRATTSLPLEAAE